MANKAKMIDTLAEYFKTKGRVLNIQEYSRETDTPIRLQQVRNTFGTWNKVEKLIMARDPREAPEAVTDIDDIINARNAAAHAASEKWKEASENQDAKARREAEAQHIAEILAANAATPEGANANKIAIGGPLPSEQPDFDVIGATVNVDPVTKEPTVVDTKPELVTTSNEDPRTPLELRRAVKEEKEVGEADVSTGSATEGGSQGQASISTAQALGSESGDVEKVEDDSKVAASSTSSRNRTKTPVEEAAK